MATKIKHTNHFLLKTAKPSITVKFLTRNFSRKLFSTRKFLDLRYVFFTLLQNRTKLTIVTHLSSTFLIASTATLIGTDIISFDPDNRTA